MSPWFEYPRFDWQDRHAIVIGAGIAGCQMTWHLSQFGWRVTLIEQEATISNQASGNLAGVISPKMTSQMSDSEQFYLDAFHYTTQQLKRLLAKGAEIDWQPCGMLQLAHNDRELQRWEALRQRNLDTDLIQLVDQVETAKIAGIPCDYPASYFPNAGDINPVSFCHGLLADSNYQLIQATEAVQLQRDTDQSNWNIFDDNQKLLAAAEAVVICNGKDLNQFKQSNFITLANVLGQTSLTDEKLNNELSCVICHEGYLTPSYKGKHVFGATFDRQFSDIELTPEANQRNLSQLQKYLPKWAESIKSIRNGHAAARPTTSDRYPFAGGLPDVDCFKQDYEDLKHGRTSQSYPKATYQDGLFVLGGFGSRGLTTSGYCANALSHLMSNQTESEQDKLLTALHPARFLVRQMKRGKA